MLRCLCDADADFFADAFQADGIVLDVASGHGNGGMAHEGGNGLDIHTFLD